jgi:hypothetical protein
MTASRSRGEPASKRFKTFHAFKMFKPHFCPPPRRGGGCRRGFERLKLFERMEPVRDSG